VDRSSVLHESINTNRSIVKILIFYHSYFRLNDVFNRANHSRIDPGMEHVINQLINKEILLETSVSKTKVLYYNQPTLTLIDIRLVNTSS
jgi:hypothetical protein